ncbi:MAG: zinc ribbon domain-containing protein [Coriobacteriia bacterium]|nr:zinc ribbon domain-containing protein [Coriobacteriia bacterium]
MSKVKQYRLRVAGIVAIMASVAGVAYLLHADSHVAGSVVARPLTWLAPLLTVLVIAGVGWILLGQHRSEERQHPSFEHCPSCQRDVLGKWRMCPYCGAMIDDASTSSTAAIGHTES